MFELDETSDWELVEQFIVTSEAAQYALRYEQALE
jgi:hypothetical protein